jgi:hypothetical protein
VTPGHGPAARPRRSGRPRLHRLLGELRSPAGLRRALLAKEILDPPVTLRDRRGPSDRPAG